MAAKLWQRILRIRFNYLPLILTVTKENQQSTEYHKENFHSVFSRFCTLNAEEPIFWEKFSMIEMEMKAKWLLWNVAVFFSQLINKTFALFTAWRMRDLCQYFSCMVSKLTWENKRPPKTLCNSYTADTVFENWSAWRDLSQPPARLEQLVLCQRFLRDKQIKGKVARASKIKAIHQLLIK